MGDGPDHPDPGLTCEAVHRALDTLPQLATPSETRVSDGLYFFHEQGEVSPHAPRGRVVRVGNHPRSDGTLVRRLSQHYSGRKNGSVFRKALGGALLRQGDPAHPCLAPAPGAGHWERQGGDPCERCMPIEAEISRLLRDRFTFRVVAVGDRSLRNELEGRLVATFAACPTCRPSREWLGRHAYGPAMRTTGLWNTEFVEGPTLTEDQLDAFEELVAETARATPPRRPASTPTRIPKTAVGDPARGDPAHALVVIPCSSGKDPGSDHRGSGPAILEYLPDDLGQRLRDARAAVSVLARVDQTRMPAWRRYGRGLLYRAAGASLAKGIERWPHILILSGAYGVVTATEPIAYYGRQLHLGDWPRGLLQEVLASYAETRGIERVFAFAARSGDYRTLLNETEWPARVRAAGVYMPAHGPGVDAREATPRVMGAALAAFLDGHADLTTWRDPVAGSWLEMELSTPSPRSAPAPSRERQVSASAVAEVRDALQRYRAQVEAASIADNTKKTYLDHAERFVRWLDGDFLPGSRRGG